MTDGPEAEPRPRRKAVAGRRRVALADRDIGILRSLADRIDPEDAGAHNNLGVVFFQKGLTSDALAAFERALELDPRLDVARRNAEVAFRESGRLESRVARLRAEVAERPDDVAPRDALARTLLLGGDPEAAAREWQRLLDSHPASTPLHMKLAYALAESGRRVEALALLDRAARLSPTSAAVRLQRAELLHDAGDLERAGAEARRALELDDSEARAHAFFARVLREMGRAEEADRALARAEELDPDVARSEAHLSLERYRSVDVARRQTGRGPETAAGGLDRFVRAVELRRGGDLEAAAVELEESLVEDGDREEARQALAEIRLLQGRLEDALQEYEAVLAARADSPKLWNERGVTLHRLSRLEPARAAYRRVVSLDEGYALGWNNLGVALAQLGEAAAAERAFRTATRDDPPPELLWNLGLFLSLQERADEAVEVYRAAVAADDEVAESWSRLGGALFQAHQLREARDVLIRALELDPERADARYHLGFVLSSLGDFQGALRETKRALEREPVMPTPVFQLLIDVQFEAGSLPAPQTPEQERVRYGTPVSDFDFEPAALDQAFEALRGPSREPVRREELDQVMAAARVAMERGKLRAAADRAARAAALAPGEPETLLLQGEVLLRQGLAGEALERFQAAAAAGGEDGVGGHEGAARALLELGRVQEAVAAATAARAAGGTPALLARALLAAGHPERATPVFEALLAEREGDPGAGVLAGYGEALLEVGRPRDAEVAFRRALEVAQGVAARVGLARALTALGDERAAAAEYREALRVLPSHTPAALGLAELEWRVGRRGEAVGALVDLLTVDPTAVEALVRLGSALSELGRTEQAERAFRRALVLEPGHRDALRALAAVEGS